MSFNNITLRKLSASDINAFYEWASDSQVAKNLTWNPYQSKKEALAFLTTIVDLHPWFMAICLDGKPIGSITLERKNGASQCRAELGYVLTRSYWGKGLMTKAVKLAIEQGFSDLNVVRIEAFVDPMNKASARVLEKAGFVKEGYLRNYLVFKGEVKDRLLYSYLPLRHQIG